MIKRQPSKADDSASLARYTFILGVAWVLAVVSFASWNIHHVRISTCHLAIESARAHLAKDHAFRLWATGHGGVYVPVDEKTVPSPYLAHVAERDINLPSGTALTLINPAYMVRQMQEEFAGLYQISGHISSLHPLRPENLPDGWERKALEALERGEKDIIEFTSTDEAPLLRLMQPIHTEEGCLKCHAIQGYKVGDVRGGVSVALPMTPYLVAERAEIIQLAATHAIILVLGLAGIVFGYLGLRRQVRKRLEAQEALSQHLALLEIKNRELQDFAHVASHDLQEPLRKIVTFADMLQGHLAEDLPDSARDYVRRMAGAAERMQELIQSLLDYARITTKTRPFAAVDLRRSAREALQNLETTVMESGAVIHVGELPEIQADSIQLVQLFQNLIGNALKFRRSDKTATVEITSRRIESFRGVPGNWCEIMVEDNGIGFEERYLDRIFRPFERLHGKQEYKGAGMGLAICSRIAERHGGGITARANPGKGATFVVTLPVEQK